MKLIFTFSNLQPVQNKWSLNEMENQCAAASAVDANDAFDDRIKEAGKDAAAADAAALSNDGAPAGAAAAAAAAGATTIGKSASFQFEEHNNFSGKFNIE